MPATLTVFNGTLMSCDNCLREPCEPCEPDLDIADGTGSTGVRVGVFTSNCGRDGGPGCGSGADADGITLGFRDIETMAGSSNGGGAAFAAVGADTCTDTGGGGCTKDGGAGGGAKPGKAGGGAFMKPGGAKVWYAGGGGGT